MIAENRPPNGGGCEPAVKIPPPDGRRKTKTRHLLAILSVSAAVCAALAHASRRVPTRMAEGGPIAASANSPAAGATFRVGTFNIHGAKGTDGRRDVNRVAETLTGLQIVGLNEVHGGWFWQRADQADALGQRLQMNAVFAPFETRWYHYALGNGLLTSLGVRSWQRYPLSGGSRPRNILIATLEHGGRAVRVLVTHLSRRDPGQRDEELDKISRLFLALSRPAILLGDLNTDRSHPVLARLLATSEVVDALAVEPSIPQQHIDWILLRGLRAIRGGMVDRQASDHPLFWAEVEVHQTVE